MVFESIVADVLNRFLGDYVENLDRSQLKIGIWGGDVVLNNLVLKETALDDLNLPVKTTYGCLGKLVLKIPWKNIYSAPVEARIEGLYLLVVPSQDQKYDAQKEERFKQEAKQSQLAKVEAAKKKEREKDKEDEMDAKGGGDSFTEKLVAQIIRNVQIFVADIHVRYEDRITKGPDKAPFSVGLTLHSLTMTTTNEGQDQSIFHKILTLDGLSVYWNTPSSLFIDENLKAEEMAQRFKETITAGADTIPGFNYILGPINATSRLQLNLKPELQNFEIPKILLSLDLELLLMCLTRAQYQDLIAFVDSLDRMFNASQYRKYRPALTAYKGHYKQWWSFAVECILEETVRRRRRNWDWNVILLHRQTCKKYATVYRTKLTTTKHSAQLLDELAQLEKALDAFNIILVRQRVENEVEREGRLMEERQKLEPKKNSGWFGGWFSSNNTEPEGTGSSSEGTSAADILKRLEEAMSEEEREKLCKAIDYHENADSLEWPADFVAIRNIFNLKELRLTIRDRETVDVLTVQFKDVCTDFRQRPSARAMFVNISMRMLSAYGLSEDSNASDPPRLIKSKIPKSSFAEEPQCLLNILWETNPEDGSCDQRLHVVAKPLKVVYDAPTIIKFVQILTPERDISQIKNQIQAAANAKLADLKEKSALSLQYAIEKRTRLDLRVDFMAPYLILPYGGRYTKNVSVIVMNLGQLNVTSSRSIADVSVRQIIADNADQEGANIDDETALHQQFSNHTYDKFTIQLTKIQVLTAYAGERWNNEGGSDVLYRDSGMHILHPTSLEVNLQKCLIDDDPRFPNIKVDADLPRIVIKVHEKRMLDAMALLLSLPFPQSDDSEQNATEVKDEQGIRDKLYSSTASLRHTLDSLNQMNRTSKSISPWSSKRQSITADNQIVQLTNLQANFRLEGLTIAVESDVSPIIEATVDSLKVAIVQQTYKTSVQLTVDSLAVVQHYRDLPISAIKTPECQQLFSVDIALASKNSPDFESVHKSVVLLINVQFAKLHVLAHLEAILSTLRWVDKIQRYVKNTVEAAKPKNSGAIAVTPEAAPVKTRTRNASSSSQDSFARARLKQPSVAVKLLSTIKEETKGEDVAQSDGDVVDVKIVTRLDEIVVELESESRGVATVNLNGFDGVIALKESCTDVNVNLRQIVVTDPTPDIIYRKVLYVAENKEALSSRVVLYNEVESGGENFDVVVKLRISRLAFVFVNQFVTDIAQFANQFQNGKQAIVDASAAALSTTKTNLQQAYQSATKVSLDVDVNAPIIYVPVNSNSYETICVDFGKLIVSNELMAVNSGQVDRKAIVDQMNLKLLDMKIARCLLAPDWSVKREWLVLKPASYTLEIKRNLSSSWFAEIADVAMVGNFESLHASLCDDDYSLVMRLLKENIEAGSTPTISTPSKTPLSSVTSLDSSDDKSPSTATSNTVQVVAEVSETTDDDVVDLDDVQAEIATISAPTLVRSSIQFKFAMENVVCELFNRRESEATGLAKLTLDALSLEGTLMSDASMKVVVSMADCVMDDTRPSKLSNPVTRYMFRKACESRVASTSKECRGMVDVTYSKKGDESTIDAKVFSFVLIFNADHIFRLQKFFTPEITPEKERKPAANVAKVKYYNSPKKTIAKAKNLPAENEPASKPDPKSITWINLIVEQPDIILVEQLDTLDTDALILNTKAAFKVGLTGDGKITVNGSVDNTQLYSCGYNPKIRDATTSLVLHPTSVFLAGSTPEGAGMNLEIRASPIKLSITPKIIEQLSRVSKIFAVDENENDAGAPYVANYESLWLPREFDSDSYWFSEIERGVDALCGYDSQIAQDARAENEVDSVTLINAPSISIIMEAGAGYKSTPTLMVDAAIEGRVCQNSRYTAVDMGASLSAVYYNSRLAVWEPLIELLEFRRIPIEPTYEPWQVRLTVAIRKQQEEQYEIDDEVDGIAAVDNVLDEPATKITLSSSQRLELTLSKCCLDALTELGECFNTAINSADLARARRVASSEINTPYLVENHLGKDVFIAFSKDSPFKLFESEEIEESVLLKNGDRIGLYLRETPPAKNISDVTASNNELKISVGKSQHEVRIPISKPAKRHFPLPFSTDDAIVVETRVASEGVSSAVIRLRSPLQINNHFSVPIKVFAGENQEIGVVEPGQNLNPPFEAIAAGDLYFSTDGYSQTTNYPWKELTSNVTLCKKLEAYPENAEDRDPFYINVIGKVEKILHGASERMSLSSLAYAVDLRPTVVVRNYLPVTVVCCQQGEPSKVILEPAAKMDATTTDPGRSTLVFRIDDYMNQTWTCKKMLESDSATFEVWPFTTESGAELNLGMWTENKKGSLRMSLYCPFWMINKTGLPLSYKRISTKSCGVNLLGCWQSSASEGVDQEVVAYHSPENASLPILFSFSKKEFFASKRKASMRVGSIGSSEGGDQWSQSFSLDVAGSSGVVTCVDGERTYQIGVYIRLNYNSLTRQVIFSPFYTLINKCPYNLWIAEYTGDDSQQQEWLKINADECIPLWPKYADKKMIRLKVDGTDEVSFPLMYAEMGSRLLKLRNRFGGVSVEVQTTEGGVYVTFTQYQSGAATALLVNFTPKSFAYSFKSSSSNSKEAKCENPFQLAGLRETLVNCDHCSEIPVLLIHSEAKDRTTSIDLRKDGVGELKDHSIEEDGCVSRTYWVSFLDGMQRVLLVTTDATLLTRVQNVSELQTPNQQIIVSLQGVGVSLVDNYNVRRMRDIMYISVSNSDIRWETQSKPGQKFKPVKCAVGNATQILEPYFEKYSARVKIQREEADQEIEIPELGIRVNFGTGHVVSPNVRKLRRTYSPGVWVCLGSSDNSYQIHAKMHRLQIDNQSVDCIFPVMFAPVPPPKSVANQGDEKPFIELSLVERLNERTSVRQYNYFKVLVQEFHVKVEIGFINTLMKFFKAGNLSDSRQVENFCKDTAVVSEPLISYVSALTFNDKKNYYDLLHFSPLKIHVSFSLTEGDSEENANCADEDEESDESTSSFTLLSILTRSIGVTLTDLNDVVFRLAYFERQYTFLTQAQLMAEVQTHYTGQLIKQLYVLVFGLDVLGNPFGLVVGLKQGVEDLFYEPFQGAIQGPSEFAEGLVLGVRSLFGHTVGGAAGAVGRITGAVGKGLAALTLDEDYQRSRRQRMTTKNRGIGQSGKGLVMGVVEGVGGVVTKPLEGAREDGVGGFFKGVGKGMVGLIARPASGLVDFASGTVDTVRRVTTGGSETTRYREPRAFLSENGVLTSYSATLAEGNKLLTELHKGRYARTDKYVFHMAMPNIKQLETLLLTDNRILYLVRACDVFCSTGPKVEWEHMWCDMSKPAEVVEGGFCLYVKDERRPNAAARLVTSIFKTQSKGKILLIPNPNISRWLVNKSNELIVKNRRAESNVSI